MYVILTHVGKRNSCSVDELMLSDDFCVHILSLSPVFRLIYTTFSKECWPKACELYEGLAWSSDSGA